MRQLDNIDLTYSDILFLLRFIFIFLKHKIFWLILRLHHHGWLLFFLAGKFYFDVYSILCCIGRKLVQRLS